MRIKLEGNVIEKTKQYKTNYAHEIYSMVLNKISMNRAANIHSKKKFYRLLTFTNIFIENKQCHLYISGEDNLIKEFIEYISFDSLIRVDDMVININNIQLMNDLKEKDIYKFKTKAIINIQDENKKAILCEDIFEFEDRLNKSSIKKCNSINQFGELKIKVINSKIAVTKYKDGHIFSYKGEYIIKGDYNMVNALFNIGLGENTASGHGFLWEV